MPISSAVWRLLPGLGEDRRHVAGRALGVAVEERFAACAAAASKLPAGALGTGIAS